MDEQRLDDQLEPIFSSSVQIQDVAWKTSRERWTGEREGQGDPCRQRDTIMMMILTLYILLSTDRLFRFITTLQCGLPCEMLQAGFETRLTLEISLFSA